MQKTILKKKHIVYACSALAVCLLAGFAVHFLFVPKTESEELPLVAAYRVQSENDGDKFTYSGLVCSKNDNSMAFQTGGKVLKKYVSVGDSVHKGELLMQLDTSDLQQVVNASSAQIEAAQAQLALNSVTLDRYKKLFESGGVSQAELDARQTAYDASLASVKALTAQNTQASNQVGYASLRAVCDGVIASVNTDVGQIVAPGQNVITIAGAGDKEIEINVPENRLPELRGSKAITVRFWAIPKLALSGTVREIAPLADLAAHTYMVRISLADVPSAVQLGMTASVDLYSNNANGKNTVFIPLSAVYQTGKTPTVWIIEKGTVHSRQITAGEFADNQLEVLQGLNSGEVIAEKGVHELREGMKVRIADGDMQ